MWTHETPYRHSELTVESIRQHGRIALSRALNTGRIIGFIGSGVTVAYGRSSWPELIGVAIHDLARRFRGLPQEEHTTNRVPLYALADQINRILGQDILVRKKNGTGADRLSLQEINSAVRMADADDLVTVLECVENLDELLGAMPGPPRSMRKAIRDTLRTREADLLARRAREAGVPEPATGFAGLTREQDLRALLHGAITGRATAPGAPPPPPDPLDALFGELRIKRFLTLNFDVEIERWMADRLRLQEPLEGAGAEQRRDLKALLAYHDEVPPPPAADDDAYAEDMPRPPRRRIVVESGLERSLLSVTMTGHNVAELVAFAADSRSYSCQILHLHGRIDDPEHMVLTERDYQRTYLSEDAHDGAFNEALDAVFSGNDILFVGVGMQETDILRPLRQFVSRSRSPDYEARRIFALMERIVRRPPLEDWMRRFGKAGDAALKDALDAADRQEKSEQDLRSIRLCVQYGVHTITYGASDNAAWRRVLLAIVEAMALLSAPQTTRARRNMAKRVAAFLPRLIDFAESVEQHRRRVWAVRNEAIVYPVEGEEALPPRAARDFAGLVTQGECRQLREIIAALPALAADGAARARVIDYARSLEKDVRGRSLERELHHLTAEQARWWREWRRLPRERKSIFRNETGSRPALWVRHMPVYTAPPDPGAASRAGILVDLRAAAAEQISEQDEQADHRRRIVYVAAPRGAGKGGLAHLLRQRCRGDLVGRKSRNYEYIFDAKGVDYAGAFFAHLSFSVEFSSVVTGLARFVAGRIAEIKRGLLDSTDKDARDVINDYVVNPLKALEDYDRARLPGAGHRIHRLDLLKRLLESYAALSVIDHPAGPPPLFIALSGLDRLCDENGVAWNPMHRAFFRLLSGRGLRQDEESGDFPIHLLLISGRAERPIRYLAEECAVEDLGSALVREPLAARAAARRRNEETWVPLEPEREVALRRAVELGSFAWADRWWLQSDKDGAQTPATRVFARWRPDWIEWKRGPQNSRPDDIPAHETPILATMAVGNVAFSDWLFGAWLTRAAERGEAAGIETDFRDWLRKLESAAARRGMDGVIEEFALDYQAFDRADAEGAHRHDPSLPHIMLRHLALFGVPIEAHVLYSCPEIRNRLSAHDDTDGTEETTRRAYRFRTLGHTLAKLCRRRLVIAVRSKLSSDLGREYGETGDGTEPEWRTRYVLHDRLREHLAHRMGLSTPDEGERNHFQISLYCDQPRDLPTPSAEHYHLLRDLIDGQIQRCVRMLSAYYQLDSARRWSEGWAGIVDATPEDRKPRGLVQRRRERAHAILESHLQFGGDDKALNTPYAWLPATPQRVRAVYSLLRGAFTIGAISRLNGYEQQLGERGAPDEPLERYRGWLRMITNSATACDIAGPMMEAARRGDEPDPYGDREPFDYGILKDTDHPPPRPLTGPNRMLPRALYRDEIGWLLNERAIASLMQGRLFDALPLFERALDSIRHRRGQLNDMPMRSAERRIMINRCVALIDWGALSRARSDLEVLAGIATGTHRSTSIVTHLAGGYLGLIDHLNGHFERAEVAYRTVVDWANRERRLRVVSIFNRHWADLDRHLERLPQARERIELAIGAASQAEQRDVLNHAHISRARISIAEGDVPGALNSARQVDVYARRIGIPKLRVEAALLSANAALVQGETKQAGETAARAIAVAKRYGMRLLKIGAISSYARVLESRGDAELALILRLGARAEAEACGYQTVSGRISKDIANSHGIREP